MHSSTPSSSSTIPPWVSDLVVQACNPLPVKHSEVIQSPRGGRWDIRVELENGVEVLAWVDGWDQTPSGVIEILRLALEDSGVV